MAFQCRYANLNVRTFSSIFKGTATYGYCASKAETYYGFKGNLSINSAGVITGITMRQPTLMSENLCGMLLVTLMVCCWQIKGLIGADFQQQIKNEARVNLQTPMRDNMTDKRGKDANSWLISTRRLVETVIGQLSDRFHIEKVRARDVALNKQNHQKSFVTYRGAIHQ